MAGTWPIFTLSGTAPNVCHLLTRLVGFKLAAAYSAAIAGSTTASPSLCTVTGIDLAAGVLLPSA